MRYSQTKLGKISKAMDAVVGVFSPRRAAERIRARAFLDMAHRFASYDALDKSRLRKSRSNIGGTADKHLTNTNLDALREAHRELMRNNPMIKGLLKTERDEVVGEHVKIQAKTSKIDWNDKAEKLWKEHMIDQPVDITGRFNYDQIARTAYLSYLRDGDHMIIQGHDWLQMIEGEQCGTPYGGKAPKNYTINNGVAFSKSTGKLLGYYIGKPSEYGYYITNDSYKIYRAGQLYHIFNPERSSQSRGEPSLSASLPFIDHLNKYVEAEVVAAAVNACYTMFISRKDPAVTRPGAFTDGSYATGKDSISRRAEKMDPGKIIYGDPGEDARGIGMARPGDQFDPFVTRIMGLIGRPLGIPLMIMTLDFSGATFMNARIAYQQAQKTWKCEQRDVLARMIANHWRWFILRMVKAGKLKERGDMFQHHYHPNRWPYVQPEKEAQADQIQLTETFTTTRDEICARRGVDLEDIDAQLLTEAQTIKKLKALIGEVKKTASPANKEDES